MSRPRFLRPRWLVGAPSRATVILAGLIVSSVFAGVLVSSWFFVATLTLALRALAYGGESALRSRGVPSAGPPAPALDREYDDIRSARTAVVDRYRAEAIWYFFRLLGELPDFLSSADERATVEQFGLRLETRLSFRLTHGTSDTVLVPVLQVAKGSLVDELEIFDAENKPVPVLSLYETRGLIGWALDCLVNFARDQQAAADRPDGFDQCIEVHADELMRIVCHPHPWEEKQLALKLDETLGQLGLPEDWVPRLREFCSGLAQSDLIVVEVDRPRRLRVDLTYRQLLAYDSDHVRKDWRTALGLTPDIVDGPAMVYAARAQSYAFQLAPIPGRYVYRHRIKEVRTGPVGTPAQAVTVDDMEEHLGPVDLRRTGTGVRPHAHVAIAMRESPLSSPRREMRDYKSVVDYRETPPGALGAAALISSATAIMTTVFAVSGGGGGNGSDGPALLVALPAFMAILIGHWSDTSWIPKSSVSAYLGLLGTMLVSITGASLYLLDARDLLAPTQVVRDACCGLGVLSTSWLWLVLAGLAAAQMLYLWLRLLQSARYYRRQQEQAAAGGPDLPTGRRPSRRIEDGAAAEEPAAATGDGGAAAEEPAAEAEVSPG